MMLQSRIIYSITSPYFIFHLFNYGKSIKNFPKDTENINNIIKYYKIYEYPKIFEDISLINTNIF